MDDSTKTNPMGFFTKSEPKPLPSEREQLQADCELLLTMLGRAQKLNNRTCSYQVTAAIISAVDSIEAQFLDLDKD